MTASFEDQYWYAGALSERRCEDLLKKIGRSGAFLVRDYILPGADYNYILSVYSESEILHYDVKVFPTEECELNGYSFTSLPDAITFYTENRLHKHYLSVPEKPVVSEKTRSGGATITVAPQPSLPPRSTPLQSHLVHQQQQRLCRDITPSSQDNSGMWGPASSGEISADSYSPIFIGADHITTMSPASSQDCPGDAPDSGMDMNRPSLQVKTALVCPVDDQIVAQGYVHDSSDICETSFDDVTYSTFHAVPSEVEDKKDAGNNPPPSPEQSELSPVLQPIDTGKPEAQPHKTNSDGVTGVVMKQGKVPPPVPLRRSTLVTDQTSPTAISMNESTPISTTQSELKRIPSLSERKKQLKAHMTGTESAQGQPTEHLQTTPGRLVINKALKGVSASMPVSQHPLLRKKQEEIAAREREEREERERQEQQRLAKEQKDREEKTKKGFFRRSRRGKGTESASETSSKEQRRCSMTAFEKDELQIKFKQVTQDRGISPELREAPCPTPSSHSETAAKEEEDEDRGGRLGEDEQKMREKKGICKEELSPQPSLEQGISPSQPSLPDTLPSLPPLPDTLPSLTDAPPSLPPFPDTFPSSPAVSPSQPPLPHIPPSSPAVPPSQPPLPHIPPSSPAVPSQPPFPPPSSTPPCGQLDSLPEHPQESRLASHMPKTSSSRSNTLERYTPKPPTTSPPSLPGSIDRKTWRQSNSQSNTLERSNPGSCPGSRPGSRPGTLERRAPPPPTTQPPSLAEGRKEYVKLRTVSTGSIGLMGGRMDLGDLIPGVPRDVLTGPVPTTNLQQVGRASTIISGPINVKRKSTIKKGH